MVCKENAELKDKRYKDETIQKLSAKLDETLEAQKYGFPVSKEEHERIRTWQTEHESSVHSKSGLSGDIGGRYRYVSLPPSIGTSCSIECSCGAEYEFRKLD